MKTLDVKLQTLKAALVLSSGGARGLAHIGVIRELLKAGFTITSIAGSSIGSLIAGVYISGKLDEFTEWVCDLDQVDVFELMDFTLTGQGFIKGDRVFAELKRFLSSKEIEKLSIPYAAVAANIVTRKEVVFRSGNLTEAIRASIAIPTVITPFTKTNMVLVDGGVVSPVPANAVKRFPGDMLVVSDINANIPYVSPNIAPRPPKEHEYSLKRRIFEMIRANTNFFSTAEQEGKPPGYLDVIDRTFDIMQDSICVLTKRTYKPDLNIEVSRDAATTFQFHKAEELIEAGRMAFRDAWESFNRRKKDVR